MTKVQNIVTLISQFEQIEKETKSRLKQIDTLPYYEKFGTPEEKQKDIDSALEILIDNRENQIKCTELLISQAQINLMELKSWETVSSKQES